MSKRRFFCWGFGAGLCVIAAALSPMSARAAEPTLQPAKAVAATKPVAKATRPGTVTQETAQAAFETFSREWMKKMHAGAMSVRETKKRDAQKANIALTFSQYANEFTTELKRTSSTSAPFVGLLRYVEKEYACADATEAQCQIAGETNVTEIFRFERGQWIY